MQSKAMIFVVTLAALAGGSVQAAPVVYSGTLTPGAVVTDSVGGFGWGDEAGAQLDYWRFSGTAGQRVDIQGTRLAAGFDPAFSLFLGTTSADTAAFRNGADWGGLRFLDFGDDEVANAGPGGDPLLANFALPATGDYTIAFGGALSAGNGPFLYNLVMRTTAPGAVPAPATGLLLLGGLAAGLIDRRSKR